MHSKTYRESFLALVFSCFSIAFLISCGQAGDKQADHKDGSAAIVASSENMDLLPHESLIYPAKYTNWEMGDPASVNLVLRMYRDWDGKILDSSYSLFADSVTFDLPDGKRETAPRSGMIAKLNKFRSGYSKTENRIISIYALHNKENGNQWVSALVYSKWTYKDNKKDSMLYNDRWRVKDGKINYLLSLEHTPSRTEVKNLEVLTAPL